MIANFSDISEIRAAYTAGTLSPGLSTVIAAYDELQDASQPLTKLDAFAGECLETETISQTEHLLGPLMAQISKTEITSPQTAHHLILDDVPSVIQDSLSDALADTGWAKITRGIETVTLPSKAGEIVEIFKIAPGSSVPRHTHDGHELTLVLAGGFTDEHGRYDAGDIILMGPHENHTPTGDPDEYCYLISVRDGDILFTGWLGWMQKVWLALKAPFSRPHNTRA